MTSKLIFLTKPPVSTPLTPPYNNLTFSSISVKLKYGGTGMLTADIGYFLRDYSNFPWGVMGIDFPGVGPLICYMCRAARTFCPADECKYMNSMTHSDLDRFGLDPAAKTIHSIHDFVDATGEPGTAQGKARAMVDWLRRQQDFKVLLQQQLDALYRNGVLSIEEGLSTRSGRD
jgi:hypothetical protein